MHSVNTTTDYKQFSFLIDNRDTSRKHINKLRDAIRKNPEILEVQPILVNENMEIIDGQHRFTAASELGLPITYTQVHGLNMETARNMNVLQRKWTMEDYSRSYAKAGNPNYKEFLKYWSEYPLIKISVLIRLLAGGPSRYNTSATFKNGTWVIEQNEDKLAYLLDNCNTMAETMGVPFSSSYAAALREVIESETIDFDAERFLRKLKERPELLGRANTRKDALINMERVYNFQSKVPARLYG